MKRTRKKGLGVIGAIKAAKDFEKVIHNLDKVINIRTPDLILTSDWHLRDDQPICRTDDFWVAQWKKVHEIAMLQKKYDCLVLHTGDLFHHWKPSPYLLSHSMIYLPKKFYTIYGQHDLPQHLLELLQKSGINALRQAGYLTVLDKGSWGQGPGKIGIANHRKIGMWHKFVWDGLKIPWPGCDEMTAKEVLKKYPEYDLIVTGDHHKPFTETYKGRLLVNPGCLTRQNADYAKHKPCVWFYYSETNTVEPYYLDIQLGVVSREHLERKEESDKRMDAFITRLSNDWEVGVSFEENLERFLANNKIKPSVKDLIFKAIDNE